jgi:hypothetical protein
MGTGIDREMDERPHAQSAAPRHEPIEANVRAIWITGFVLAGVVVGSFLLVLSMMNWMAGTAEDVPATRDIGSDPNLVNKRQLQELRARERKMLSQYKWIDPAAGVARIPIDRAMQIVASKGLLETPGDSSATTPAGNRSGSGAEQMPSQGEPP